MRAIGIDPALGGGHAMLCAEMGQQLVILDALTVAGLSRTEEQIELLELWASIYRPSIVVIEFDAQQKGLGNDERLKLMANRYGFSVRPHITRGQKVDPIFGVAAMDQSFKLGDIRIPYGDQVTQDRMAALIRQLKAWRPDVKTRLLTQDLVMALWFVWRQWQKVRRAQMEPPATVAPRPSWVTNEAAYRGKALTL